MASVYNPLSKTLNITTNNNSEKITLGAGCFWCAETAFNHLEGVISAISGYMGGETLHPTYETICTGQTGHAEVIQITFNPTVISTREILEIFFTLHNPTQLNRQGNDVGTQYRSVIFYHDQEQQKLALKIIDSLNKEQVWSIPVVTEVNEKTTFYPAEAYHQGYVAKNPNNGYCQAVVTPKLAKFKQTFINKLKSS